MLTMADTGGVRRAALERNTNETRIHVDVALDVVPNAAPQVIEVKTGVGFLDHVRRCGASSH